MGLVGQRVGGSANIWCGGGVPLGVVNTVADALVALFAFFALFALFARFLFF
jgi:hypothetical protein